MSKLHFSTTPTIFFPHISPPPKNLQQMSSTPPQSPQPPPESTESTAAKTLTKRYEGLMMVRTKAIKGKGAWYWTHLQPILINSDTGVPNAVKLRCCLCDAVFSASNPSRTASEHLKPGTCPSFNHDQNPQPISSFSPTGMMTSSHRKRNSGGRKLTGAPITDPGKFMIHGSYPTRPGSESGSGSRPGSGPEPDHIPALPAPPVHNQQYVKLSGGKDDLTALAMLEDSVKRLKSPKTLPGQTLTKMQVDSSLELLTDWLYENCGSVAFSSVTHPKFKVFLNQLGLPAISSQEIAGNRLDSKYLNAKAESEARIRDALFFQVSCNGWRSRNQESQQSQLNLSVNLPNGMRVFWKGVFANGYVFSKFVEDVLMETMIEICGNNLEKCVGIVSDKFKSTALTNIENQHQWMINLGCQFQGVYSLIKDFSKELPLFKNVVDNCFKVANLVNTSSQIRNLFLKYQFQESGRARLMRVPFGFVGNEFEFERVFGMVEDVLSSARTLQLVLHDEGYQKVSMEVDETIRNPQFWREVEAVHSLVKLVKDMAQEIEKERPRIGQCLPLWEEVRVKVKDWCMKFQMNEIVVEKVFDKRFKKNYHPAWSTAFILDPFYLIKDRSGKYLPPFKYLTPDQEKDVDKLITRLVSREEAHIALMELMKWRTDGLDPVYAQAVQLKQRDPVTGKMKIANPQSSRLVWETYLTEFSSLRKVAVRLIFLHATSCGFESNSSFSKWARSKTGVEKAQKLMFIAANSRSERRDLCNDDEKDGDFFAMANDEDDNMINEVLFDASSP
ncbi:putative transcription factor/ chromatin remodeling BED-type(Zn) family [Helianthus annuus]|uniref:Transcription factor/ chromatin remodeling BED-type(Zn) family n=1 Tax=Helianthus annuus TaxID=4232 RepID=A0A9K3EKH4_HELAN|nr:uncharacterized protein LOC110899652 [Helianthus annuus]KAF5774890.1 putative transcription factor/ chromatin remodeling BED-type(Zn) family [Helianthus annuus]KAJ0478134.1 putative transcription factor/ chromatin remodeling BED-type(Zn) family [Helianthus annuus]KAJ0499016.1 putative transcription factor/ chromatin remodeling BED-type(Zn) family [Helianthus annuus]KAJ0665030.1 putative transcription factor/ chromatin remodeling BED-type(Zn) family [Helianthus annuus]KAJ0672452.1 putative t